MRRALSRTWAVTVASAALAVGALGFAHTETGAAVVRGLARMAHGGCPFGYDQAMSPVERERARENFARQHRGERRAEVRPALGFELDRTTRQQVIASLSARGVPCAAGRGMSDLTCQHVPSTALPGAEISAPERTLWFTFGTKDQLLSVVAVSRAADPRAISSAFVDTQGELSRRAGLATVSSGDADSAALARGLLRQASAEFRFSNYYAVERAANMGNAFVFTEEYRSLPD